MIDDPLTIVIVDDHQIVLQGLVSMLSRFEDRVRIVGQASDEPTAQDCVATIDPDIVLCDVRLKGTSGLDLCTKLLVEQPSRKVVLLSVYEDEQYLYQALRAGARGYLLKRIDGENLVRSLELVQEGELVVDTTLAGRAATSAAQLRSGKFWPGAHLGLTERESEVLDLLLAGVSNKQIAARLFVGEETVKSHVRSIYRKLDVNDRATAVAMALREGIFR
jgi:DNA-binding NarL/FixJ family response regulator